MLADRLCSPFYDDRTLTGSVCDQMVHKKIFVSHLKEDAILGMTSPKKHLCHIDFQDSALVITRKKLVSVDKFGKPQVG